MSKCHFADTTNLYLECHLSIVHGQVRIVLPKSIGARCHHQGRNCQGIDLRCVLGLELVPRIAIGPLRGSRSTEGSYEGEQNCPVIIPEAILELDPSPYPDDDKDGRDNKEHDARNLNLQSVALSGRVTTNHRDYNARFPSKRRRRRTCAKVNKREPT